MSPYFAPLLGHKYLSLTTFRKSGAAVATPVWFAAGGDRLYIFSLRDAGKVKRIRATPRVTVAPCTARGQTLGPAQEAVARILPEAEVPAAYAALAGRYGLAMRLGTLISRTLGRKRAYLEINSP